MIDAAILLLDELFLVFLIYGAWLVLRGGRFHRDAPEDSCHPYAALAEEHSAQSPGARWFDAAPGH